MSERDTDTPPGADFPRNTGEFRARPDISASTAEFRAFAAGGAEAERAGGRTRLALTVAVVAAVVIVIVLILALGH
jgi:hypothetical protein